MDTDRRERAKSIRAARDWLAGAENALAGEDDLAGDLKLMLARAELARIAADRRARLRRWAARLLPPLAAAVLLGWFAWQHMPAEDMIPHLGAQEANVRMETPAAVPAAVEPSQPAQGEEPFSAAVLPTEPIAERAAPKEQDTAAQAAAAAPVPVHTEDARSASPSRIPSGDLQRLMQVGGKILRE